MMQKMTCISQDGKVYTPFQTLHFQLKVVTRNSIYICSSRTEIQINWAFVSAIASRLRSSCGNVIIRSSACIGPRQ
jgi:hypothetical protein